MEANTNDLVIIKFVSDGVTRLVTREQVPTTLLALRLAIEELALEPNPKLARPVAHFFFIDSDGEEIAISNDVCLNHVVNASDARQSRKLKLHIKWTNATTNEEHQDQEASTHQESEACANETYTRENKEDNKLECRDKEYETDKSEDAVKVSDNDVDSGSAGSAQTGTDNTDPIKQLFKTLKKLNFPLAEDLQEISMDDWCAIASGYAEEIDDEIEEFLPTLRLQSTLAVEWLNSLGRRGEQCARDTTQSTHDIVEQTCHEIVDQLKNMCVDRTNPHASDCRDECESVLSDSTDVVSSEKTAQISQSIRTLAPGNSVDIDSDSDSSDSDSDDEWSFERPVADVKAETDGDQDTKESSKSEETEELPDEEAAPANLAESQFDTAGNSILESLAILGFDVDRKGDYYLALASHYKYKLEDVISALVD